MAGKNNERMAVENFMGCLKKNGGAYSRTAPPHVFSQMFVLLWIAYLRVTIGVVTATTTTFVAGFVIVIVGAVMVHVPPDCTKIGVVWMTGVVGVVIVMVIATAFGAVPLAVGVAAHEGSTLVVCLNSLRLLFGKNR